MAGENVTGIILAGGESKRMGMEKGLLEFRGKALIRYSIEVLENLCSQIIISTHSSNYNHLGYPVQPDLIPDSGPIAGIYSCLVKTETDRNLILSCDTPNVTIGLMRLILDESGGYQVVIPSPGEGMYEPLIGFYHKNNLPQLSHFIKSGNLKILDYIRTVRYKSIPVYKNQAVSFPGQFMNINSPGDLINLD